MAIVLAGLTSTFTRVPFVKPPDLQRMYTSLPRARVDATITNGTVPAKPLNDQINLQVAVDLPTTFAYRLISMVAAIRIDEGQDWDSVGQLQITNGMRGQALGQVNRHPILSERTLSFSVITPEQLYFMSPDKGLPTYIIQSLRTNVAPVVDFRFSNQNTEDSAAGVINFFASFFEYDIEQVQMYPPLVPTLTYALA